LPIEKLLKENHVDIPIHIMNKSFVPFLFIVQTRRNPQLDLFCPQQWCYQVIAKNMNELEAEQLVWFHNKIGQHVENLIKEFKIGFGM
jgi:hypothetical protein